MKLIDHEGGSQGTHQSFILGGGIGIGVGVEGKIGILIDSKNNDLGVMAGFGISETLGQAFAGFEYNTKEAGELTNTFKVYTESKVEIFLGAGLGGKYSYDLKKDSFELTFLDKTKGNIGFGIQLSVNTSVRLDINISHYFRSAGDFLDSLIENEKELGNSAGVDSSSSTEGNFSLFGQREQEFHLVDPKDLDLAGDLKKTDSILGELSNTSLL